MCTRLFFDIINRTNEKNVVMKGAKGKTIVLIAALAVLFSTAVFTNGCSHEHEYVLKRNETEH